MSPIAVPQIHISCVNRAYKNKLNFNFVGRIVGSASCGFRVAWSHLELTGWATRLWQTAPWVGPRSSVSLGLELKGGRGVEGARGANVKQLPFRLNEVSLLRLMQKFSIAFYYCCFLLFLLLLLLALAGSQLTSSSEMQIYSKCWTAKVAHRCQKVVWIKVYSDN